MMSPGDALSRLLLRPLDHLGPAIDRDVDASVLPGVAPHILGKRVAWDLLDIVRYELLVM